MPCAGAALKIVDHVEAIEPRRNSTDADLTKVVRWIVLRSQLPDLGPVVKSKPVALSRCQHQTNQPSLKLLILLYWWAPRLG